MAVAISSIGVTTYYAKGTVNKPPVDGEFVQVPDIREIPDLSPDPATIDVTSLEDTEYTRSVPGLRDLGGVVSYTTNLTQEIIDEWNGRAFVKTQDSTDLGKDYYKKDGDDFIKQEEKETPQASGLYEHQDTSADTKSVMYQFQHLDSNEQLWLCHIHPKLNQCVYIPFEPIKIMLPGFSVNSNVDNSIKITPLGAPVWDIKPTNLKTYQEYLGEE